MNNPANSDVTEAYGLKFAFPSGDTVVGAFLRDYGEFSRVIGDLAVDLKGPFLDVGANIGTVALLAASRGIAVTAVEPHPGLAGLLRHNIEVNGFRNVQVIEAAAGEITGTADFPIAPMEASINFGSVGFGSNFPTRPVQMVTLDDIVPTRCAFVKIDVEGFELDVLRGAENVLRIVRPVWLIEHHGADGSGEVLDILRSGDYILYWFFSPFVTPNSPRNGGATKILGDMNILAVPKENSQPKNITLIDPNRPRPTSTQSFPYLAQYGFSMD